MTPSEFIAKWRAAELKERSAAQEHFIDLCRLLREPTPAEADPSGNSYCFERGARKDSGGEGWADVWKRGCFAWEYKGRKANLDAAFNQLRQYALALENPPLLIASDMARIHIRTSWTNSVSEVHELALNDLVDASVRDRLKWAMSDPERLRPSETRQALTERAAAKFASLAQVLRGRGQPPQAVAHFVNRLVFCMFAEDVGLLPNALFTRMLEAARKRPVDFADLATELFGAMASGGRVGFEQVAWFNGGLFDDSNALPLERPEIDIVLSAATLDWSEIDPSILGTLFERGLDPQKRSQLGAHYTDRDKIMLIVESVVIRPLLAEWCEAKGRIEACLERETAATSRPTQTRQRTQAKRLLDGFLERLRSFRVLDPACGSGNFLHLTLQALKDLEHQTQLEAEAMGFQRGFPTVGPANVKGIEINAYAAELANVSVWVGEIQWMRRNGFAESRSPVLQPLDNIERRDAVLTPKGVQPDWPNATAGTPKGKSQRIDLQLAEADWPQADAIIGNPPFLGGKRLKDRLGEGYAECLFEVYRDRVPAEADLVCYWFAKAAAQLRQGQAQRVGLVATNSIRGGANRRALQEAVRDQPIFEAWSDERWVVEGAAVRVALICFTRRDGQPMERRLDGLPADEIYADLTARRGKAGIDLTKAQRLYRNLGIAFMGDTKGGPFDIPGEQAREWLASPANPNGQPNSDVLKPWMNGMDVVRRPAGKWIVDFGWCMVREEAALYEVPFQHVKENVQPMRQRNRRESYRQNWWRHMEPRQGMWQALEGLRRYIVTPRLAKHRLFVWCDVRICPDSQLIVIARDDDAIFGILHSRFHEAWSLRLGTSLEDRPRYTPTTAFETFPFPEGLSPDIPAAESGDDPRAQAIAEAACRLAELRDRWLNPPEWVEWTDKGTFDYPKRPVPRSSAAAKELKGRTLTNLYNARPQWLADAHAALDAAVAAAYDWSADITEEEALRRLLALNRKN